MVQAMGYVMREKSAESPPSDTYFDIIAEGFEFWELPMAGLRRAALRAARNQEITEEERA